VSGRRIVRVAPEFFTRLDELLPAKRQANGEPSATDFLLHELPRVIDRVALDVESSTFVVANDPAVRVFTSSGLLVAFLAVYLVVTFDGSIDILHLELDLS
jgi:hypothetical protein